MAKYQDAIDWIAEVDDTEWLGDDDSAPSVTACLVADVFDKDLETVRKDIARAVRKIHKRKN